MRGQRFGSIRLASPLHGRFRILHRKGKKRPHCWGHSLKRRIGRESGKANAWRRSVRWNAQQEMSRTKVGTHRCLRPLRCQRNRALAGPKRETPSHCSTARLNPLQGSDLAWVLDDSLRCSSGKTIARCCRNVHTPIEHVRAPIFPDILPGADSDRASRWGKTQGAIRRPVET